ncbi:MAG: alpha/beta hydrolase [Bacteroidetes bacterium]|nr:alpha/beta hydrolase [Bacteroidota bacterium]
MELDSNSASNTVFTDILKHPEFEFKLFRELGLAAFGASTLGECFSVAQGMSMWDLPGWVRGWSLLTAEVEQQARLAMEQGHTTSATEHYLRAANYFHMAEYYAIIGEGEHVHLGMKCEECFQYALQGLPWGGGLVELSANGKAYPSYFLRPDDSGAPRPTLLVVPGIESSGEELYFYHGISALRRGYNVLLFQGPGQAGVLRRDPASHVQHDYEIPLQVALDFLHDRADVDNDRLALIGNGLGSYFATRVTAFDPRVKALVVNPPYLNLHRLFVEMLGQRALMFDVDYHALNELPPSLMRGDLKLMVLNMCRRFGVSRLQALVKCTEAFSVEDLLYRIHCPTLCIRGEKTNAEMVRQTEEFCSGVRTEVKDLILIPNLHESDAFNHYSNLPRLNQLVFDWLDDLFQPGASS